MTGSYDVLIVGGGHGGAQTAIALRQNGFAGTIGIVGDEPELPYERPPLSKDYLARDKPFERILIRPAAFWGDKGIEMILGAPVTAIDPARHLVSTETGGRIGYGSMVWAAGGRARRLECPGHDLDGVHSVRTRSDVDQIERELHAVERVTIIGGGYIGLEAAAVMTKLGKRVTVLEAQDRVLARVAGAQLSHFFQAEHRARGVDIRLGVTAAGVEQRGGRASGVRLDCGETIDCELVIVGIGISPSIAPLVDAGAAHANGIKVDSFCRTSLPDVFAIGDCAAHANPFARGEIVRLESVQNAVDQAVSVAKTIAKAPTPYHAVPWFWSNQYDLRLQTVGLASGHDATVLRGSPGERSFSIIYKREDRVIALDCLNATKDYVQGRRLVELGMKLSDHDLSDCSQPLKSLFPD